MPELPEVETVRRALVPVMEGRRILSAQVNRSDLRWPLPDRLAERLAGRVVGGLRRRGKFTLVALDQNETILLHLGMSGSIRIHQAEPPIGKHDHIVLAMSSPPAETGSDNLVDRAPQHWITFNDPRRFGWLDLFSGETHRMLADMGPEPLGNSFTAQYLSAAIDRRTGPIKTALLNQTLVAGIGNIYACEALFLAGLSPRRKAGTICGGRAERLVAAIRTVLTRAIADGGTSLRDHVQPGGEIGYFAQSLAVYGRAGQPCTECSSTIRSITQSGRRSFYCPDCQR